jgi:16S rRNA (uracil1498-N3)-methyltransferase
MTVPRLYVPDLLAGGSVVPLPESQAHHLRHVLRREAGSAVRLFNERDGEWTGTLGLAGRSAAAVALTACIRPPRPEPGPWLLFAPIKRQRLDPMIEKATELGAERLIPVLTRHVAVERVRIDRLQAIAIGAAEQCERLTIPVIEEPQSLLRRLADWPDGRPGRPGCPAGRTGRGLCARRA